MNIFILHWLPKEAARMYCDKHVPKMVVELLQQMAAALIRHGATPDMMPLSKKGTPLKGGYPEHPCTLWVGESRDNYIWAARHALALCEEYTKRFGKTHFCEAGITQMTGMAYIIPEGERTPFALAMFNEYRPEITTDAIMGVDKKTGEPIVTHAWGMDAVIAYRNYYIGAKTFAKWEKGTPAPFWWDEPVNIEVIG